MTTLLSALFGGLISSVVWFVLGGALYMNPFIAKIYHSTEYSPALKKWPNVPQYLGMMFLFTFVQGFLFALVYLFMKSVLPVETISRGLVFGLVLIAIKIIPRFLDMWIQTTYPNRLLTVELINGSIGSFIMGLALAYVI